MENVLPIVMPPIETYQNTTFIMGVVMANENIKNCFYNFYNNVMCNKTSYMKNIILQFEEFDWEPYREQNLAEMNLFHVKYISKNLFSDFIKERIDQGNYILLYKINEYYLSYSKRYNVKHYVHDTYIYGYRDDKFKVMALSKGKIQFLEVDENEIVDALYSYMADDPDAHFCTFRISKNNVSVDVDMIKQGISSYLEKADEDTKVYGIRTYRIIRSCTAARAEGKKQEGDLFDLRIFRMIWEHKKIMLLHLEMLNGLYNNGLEISLSKMVEIEHIANQLFILAMKFTVTKKNDILLKLIEIMTQLEDKEKKCYEELIQHI